jgi:hypothetical protein
LCARPHDGQLLRQEVTVPGRLAIRRDRIDLGLVVGTWDVAVRSATIRATHDDHDVTSFDGPFALNTEQSRTNVQHQVVSFVAERPRDTSTVLQRLECNRLFSQGAFLVRRQH